MSTPTTTCDPKTKRPANVLCKEGRSGLVVFTETFDEQLIQFEHLTNDDYGVDMTQNAGFGGTPELVHDGIDAIAWTGSSVVGTDVTFDNTARPHTGTKAVLVNAPDIDDVWQFLRASSVDLTAYTALTLWVNIDRRWDAGDSFSLYGWDTASGLMVGTPVLLEDYMNEATYDVWHKLVIPLQNMGLESSSVDAFRMQKVASQGQSPRFYIDDFQIEETGTPIDYRYTPPDGTPVEIAALRVSIADSVTAVSEWNKLLGVAALATGMRVAITSNGKALFDGTFSHLMDFLKFPGVKYETSVGAATTWLTIELPLPTTPFKMRKEKGDGVLWSIQDDMTGLDWLCVSVLTTEVVT